MTDAEYFEEIRVWQAWIQDRRGVLVRRKSTVVPPGSFFESASRLPGTGRNPNAEAIS